MRETYRWSIYACELERPPPPHSQRERERKEDREREKDGEEGRGTNKVFVSDVCDRIEDCPRERETEYRSPGEGEGEFYASKTDINHVSI